MNARRLERTVVALALSLLAGVRTAGAGEAPAIGGVATVAPFKKPPVIDGKIAPGEWDGAVRTTGFQNIGGQGELDARTGSAYFGFTDEALYLAVVSEMPPDGKLHAGQLNRDSDVIWDEGVEIWLDPNRANRPAAQGDLTFYQLIANAIGTIYDVAFHPKTGPNTGWNGHWQFKNSVDHEKHVWTAELSLPWSDFGWPKGSVVGKNIGVLIARNYKMPWVQCTWFPVRGAFVDWYRYAEMRLTSDSPSVQIVSLGDKVHAGELQLRATIANPGPARQAKVKLGIKTSDMPELNDEKTVDLPANGTASYSFDVPANRLHEDAQHTLSLAVTSPDAKEAWLRYGLPWTQAPEKRWHYRVGADPDAAVRFAYYPSYKFVRVLVDTRELGKEAEAIRTAKVALAGPSGRKVLNEAIAWEKAPATQEFQIGDIPDGDYILTVTLDGWKEPFVRTFKRIHFPWEGNRLGITDRVLPPFEPIRVKGNKVSVVLREHKVGGLGLWDQVTSLGRDLLADSMELVADGRKALHGKGQFTETRPNAAVYEGRAEHRAVTVATKCTTECDGCMRVEVTLSPGAARDPLKSLWLDIPLRDKEMPLWHVTSTTLRVNPAGETPKGEGVVWDSAQFPDGNWHGNFKCYLWLGGAERGLCWFADNDAGWVLSTDDKGVPNVPCQQLIRKGGNLTLRVNLVQKPVTLTEPRTIVFGLMASPGKPMKPNWRRIGITEESRFNMCYCAPATYCAKTPWGGDFSIADWAYQKRTGRPGPDKALIEAWKERHFPKDMDPKFRDSAINLALGPFLGTFGPKQNYYKMYFEEFHTTAQVHPESHVFQSEWSGNWYGKLLDRPTVENHKMWGIGCGGIVPSYRDFACWYAAEWVKRGIGCYFDNAFPLRAYDLLTTNAYKLPDGRVQPSAGMWARRDYLRRVWVIHQTMAPKDATPIMMIHMTNTHILPYMVWNEENLDLEWKFGPEPQQSKFPHDMLRAESLGRQTGNAPYVIANVQDAKTKEEAEFADRTRFGAMFVHEIRWFGGPVPMAKLAADFGYGQDDCQVWNYWDDDYPVESSDPQAKSLLLKRGGEFMLIVATWNPKPADVKFTLDTRALKLRPTTVLNEEKKEETFRLDARRATFTVPLEGYGVRILRVR